MLFTDKVKITTTVIDPNFNSMDEVSTKTVSAYVENYSEINYSSGGQSYTPDYLIFLPADTVITMQDTISIINIHGAQPIGDEVGEKQVKKVKRVGGIRISHLEVFV